MFAEVIPLDFLVFVLDFGFSMQNLVGSSISSRPTFSGIL